MTNDFQTACVLSTPLPYDFIFPKKNELENGDERCDHPCDVEYIQNIDGSDWAISIIWTTDGGINYFDETIGHQWIGSIEQKDESVSWYDSGWKTKTMVILDCNDNISDENAIDIVYNLLRTAIKH